MTGSPIERARACLIVVCGLPGSGKTTVAARLAAERGGLRMCPDEWMTALGVNLWEGGVRDRVEALQWSLTRDLLPLGTTVVIEWGTWARVERDALRDEAWALGARAELIDLDVPPDELWRRIDTRRLEDPPIRRDQLEAWYAAFERPTKAELTSYDAWSVRSDDPPR